MSLPVDLLRLSPVTMPRLPLVMGIVNVTPDSFSDGGLHATTRAAIDHGLKLAQEGADLLDIGGESTRPQASPVGADEEAARVLPVIAALHAKLPDLPLSVDTTKAVVARRALAVGACIVNDISAAGDPEMLPLCAQTGATLVLMHMRGTPQTMQSLTDYTDVAAEVRDFLASRVDAAMKAGVKRENLWVDPGFGFAKTPEQNCELVRRLPEITALGLPVLLGVSRKSTLGKLTGSPVEDREPESLAGALVGALKGASVLRTHEAGWLKRALMVVRAMW